MPALTLKDGIRVGDRTALGTQARQVPDRGSRFVMKTSRSPVELGRLLEGQLADTRRAPPELLHVGTLGLGSTSERGWHE
jgi:hypothetical protein